MCSNPPHSYRSLRFFFFNFSIQGYNTVTGRLEIVTCANQDPLQATTGLLKWSFKVMRNQCRLYYIYICIYFSKCPWISIYSVLILSPYCNIGLVPLLGIDVWEHAYYLQYKNVRADYLKVIANVPSLRSKLLLLKLLL